MWCSQFEKESSRTRTKKYNNENWEFHRWMGLREGKTQLKSYWIERSQDIVHSSAWRNKLCEKKEKVGKETQGIEVRSNTHLTEVLEGKVREMGKMMAENLNPQVSEAQWTLQGINKNNCTPRDSIVNVWEVREKENYDNSPS